MDSDGFDGAVSDSTGVGIEGVDVGPGADEDARLGSPVAAERIYESGGAVLVGTMRVEAFFEEHADDGGVLAGGGALKIIDARWAEHFCIRALPDEETDCGFIAWDGQGYRERGASVARFGVDFPALRNEQTSSFEVPGGVHERSRLGFVAGVRVAASFENDAESVGAAIDGSVVERRIIEAVADGGWAGFAEGLEGGEVIGADGSEVVYGLVGVHAGGCCCGGQAEERKSKPGSSHSVLKF
jgi:hypothetical protein